MARDIWFASDHHLLHENILKFKDDDGTPIRSFKDVKEMNETILERHNSLVKPDDIVYFMGDVTFKTGHEFDELFNKFHGRKRLIIGNHDPVKNIHVHFQKVMVWRVFREAGDFIPFTVSHIPLHFGSVKGEFNVHGHTHTRDVRKEDGTFDLRYLNLSVEQSGYFPINMGGIQAELTHRRKKLLCLND